MLCCTGSLDGGGSERQLLQFATHLNPQRYQAQIYLHHARGVFLEQVPAGMPVHAFWSDVSPRPTLLPGRIHALQIKHLIRVIQQERIEVVYDRTFHMTLVTAAACRATKTARLSVIVSPPSRDFETSRERFRWMKRKRLKRAYADPASVTVAVSDAVADDAANYYGLKRNQIRVLPSPVNIDAIQVAAADVGAFKEQEKGTLSVVVVGRLSAEKGQRTAIDALALAKQLQPSARIKLDLLGDGPLRNELEKHVVALELQSQVRFCGFAKNPYPWIANADLLCIPSEYEGLPNVALEAMALGTPVVASNCSLALKELLGTQHERGCLVPVGDTNFLAEEFLQYFRQERLWESRAGAAAAWVREHRSLEKSVDELENLFDESLRRRSMGRSP